MILKMMAKRVLKVRALGPSFPNEIKRFSLVFPIFKMGDGFDATTLIRYDNHVTGHERGEFLTWNYRTIENEILGHLNEKNGEVSGNPIFL